MNTAEQNRTEHNSGEDCQKVSSTSHLISAIQGLDRVEQLVSSKLVSESKLIEEISRYLLRLGGKRIRPALTLLVAKSLGMPEPTPQLIQVAAGIELIHMATLLHDDIIDHAPQRRREISPYARFGMESTLLSGDFLLTRAFSLCAKLDSSIIDATERACIELTEGEIEECALALDQHNRQTSLTIARKKTAALFRLGAFSAARLCNCSDQVTQLCAEFAEKLGIAFQILDDVLDVVADQNLLGKECGTDIRERKPSLVNILWLESNSTLANQLTKARLPADEEETFIRDALSELRHSSVITQARRIAEEYSFEARSALERALDLHGLGKQNPMAIQLLNLVEYSLRRMC